MFQHNISGLVARWPLLCACRVHVGNGEDGEDGDDTIEDLVPPNIRDENGIPSTMRSNADTNAAPNESGCITRSIVHDAQSNDLYHPTKEVRANLTPERRSTSYPFGIMIASHAGGAASNIDNDRSSSDIRSVI
jgi:hypothetical protein